MSCSSVRRWGGISGQHLLVVADSWAQEVQNPVIARIDEEVIFRSEAELELKRATRGKEISAEALPQVQAAVLQLLIDRRLVLRQLAAIKRIAQRRGYRSGHQPIAGRLEDARRNANELSENGRPVRGKICGSNSVGKSVGSVSQSARRPRICKSFLENIVRISMGPNGGPRIFCGRSNRPRMRKRKKKSGKRRQPCREISLREKSRSRPQPKNIRKVPPRSPVAISASSVVTSRCPKVSPKLCLICRHPPSARRSPRRLVGTCCSGPKKSQSSRTWQEAEAELRPAVAAYLFDYHAAQEQLRSPKIEGTADWPLPPR